MRPVVIGIVDASVDVPPMRRVSGDDLATLARLERLSADGRPVMVDTTAGLADDDLAGSLTRAVWALTHGATAVATYDATGVAQAIRLLTDEVAG